MEQIRLSGRGVLIGRCSYVGSNFARLEPLIASAPGGWASIVDRRGTFPDTGRVFVPGRTLQAAQPGSLWQFTPEGNERYRPGHDDDRIIASNAKEPMEMLDMSALGTIEAARRRLVEEGLELSYVPTRRVLIALPGARCAMLELKRDASDRWHPASHQNLSSLELLDHRVSAHAGATVGPHRFVLPDRIPNEVLARVDWCPDVEFTAKLIKFLKRTVPFQPGGEFAHLTRRSLERFATALRDGDLLAEAAQADGAFMTRLDGYVSALKAGFEPIEPVLEAILEGPIVRARVEAAVVAEREIAAADMRDNLEAAVRAEVEREHASERDRVDAVRADAARLERDLDLRRARIAEMEAEREAVRSALTDDLQRLADTVGRAGDALFQGGRFKASLPGRSADIEGLPPAELPPWTFVAPEPARPVAVPELAALLGAREQRYGFAAGSLVLMDALARAGEVVMLLGSDSGRALSAYAGCVASGAMHRMVLDADVLTLDDLWRKVADGSPTPFGHAWRSALRDPSSIVVAVLDDLDASFVAERLPRLTAALGAVGRPTNLLVFATASAAPRRERMPSAASMRAIVPLAFEGDVGGAIATAHAASGDPLGAHRLVNSVSQAPPAEAVVALTRALPSIEGIDPQSVGRSLRVMRSATASMPAMDALALATSMARFHSTRLGAAENLGPALARGAVLLAARCAADTD